MDEVVRTSGLTKRFDDVTAVDGIDLVVRAGERVGLLGPNGAGKTTTLLMLLGVIARRYQHVRLSPASAPLLSAAR